MPSKDRDIQKVQSDYYHELILQLNAKSSRKPSLEEYDRWAPRNEHADRRRESDWIRSRGTKKGD